MISNEKSVGAAVFRKEEGDLKFLLLHYRSGHWDFPKGHVEEGENDEETLRREIKEETGIEDIDIFPGFNKEVGYFYEAEGNEKKRRIENGRGTKVKKKVIYYLAETDDKTVELSHEHTGYEWLDYKSALKRITYKNSKDVLGAVNEFFSELQGWK